MDVITKRCAPADGPVVIMYSCFDGSKEVLLGSGVHNTQGGKMGGGGWRGLEVGWVWQVEIDIIWLRTRSHFRGLNLT